MSALTLNPLQEKIRLKLNVLVKGSTNGVSILKNRPPNFSKYTNYMCLILFVYTEHYTFK